MHTRASLPAVPPLSDGSARSSVEIRACSRKSDDAPDREKSVLQSVYDTIPCGIVRFTLDPDPVVLSANETAYRLIDYSRSEFAAETPASLLGVVHPEDLEMVRERVGRIIATRRPDTFNYRIVRRNGAVRWFCGSLNIVDGLDGTPVLQAVYSDITETQRLQREQDATYANIPGGVAKYLVRDGFRLLEANDNFYRMLGTTREHFHALGQCPIFPEDRETLRDAVFRYTASNDPVDVELRCRRFDDGSTVWLHLCGRFVGMRDEAKLYQCVLVDITEQKTARMQLDRERERYRIAMENSADVIYEYDLRADVISIYENLHTERGMEVIRHRIENYTATLRERRLVWPEDLPLLLRVLSGETSDTVEVRLRATRRPGDVFAWCRVQGTLVYEEGAPTRVVGLIQDISETKHIHQEKEELQKIFDLELSRDYENICRIDTADGRYRLLTPGGRPYYGVPQTGSYPAQLAALAEKIVCAEDRPQYMKALRLPEMMRVLDQGTKEGVVYYRSYDAANHLRWKCARYTYFRQNRSSILVNVRDVHDIRMAQQREENRFSVLLREACETVMEVNVETGAYNLYLPDRDPKHPPEPRADYNALVRAYAARSVVPEEREDFVARLSLPAVWELLREKGGTCATDFTVRERGGGLSYKNWNMFLCNYDDKEYILSYVKDVTGRVLELREREREAEKNRRIIKDALAAAEQASSAKSEFLSRMSHEIRTPMNAVIGMTAITKASLDDPKKAADCLDKIHLASRFLLSLINDILDMSRIESGKMSILKEAFDFKAFLRGVSSLIYPQARAKGLSFELSIEGLTGERYIGDALRVNQVLINILANALKFTPQGGSVRLDVRETRRVKEHAYLRFRVRDTGIGIDEERMRRIFEPFEQGDASISHRYGGSGLGLAISRNLVSLMNGHVTATSTPGHGSEFVVELPFGISRLEDSPDGDACDALREVSVLVLADDPSAREHTALILERIGARVECVASGEKAAERLRNADPGRRHYDVLLLDRRAEDQDGLKTLRRIRDLAGESLPAIALAAYDWSEIETAAREAGVDFFLTKPLFLSSVRDVLRQTGLRPTRQEPYGAPDAAPPDFSGRRILLVEDNDLNMEIARTLLEFRQASVETAWNGQEAVDAFRASPEGWYDAVLMDVRMPVKDGLAATREIRALPRADARTVPILAMTANAFAEDIEESLRSGMDEHLAKPIETEQLYARLAHCFDKAARRP